MRALFKSIAALTLIAWSLASACERTTPPVAWSLQDLGVELAELEKRTDFMAAPQTSEALEAFARRAVRRRIEVSGAHVASVYRRGDDWNTRPYFALTYDREHYLYLETLDPDFQADLARHRHWASLTHTVGNRQLMFELALSQEDFLRLRPRCQVDFTCELATVIRGGKSVYCRALVVAELDCSQLEGS